MAADKNILQDKYNEEGAKIKVFPMIDYIGLIVEKLEIKKINL